MNLKKILTPLYMEEMLRTPKGRANLLAQIADAEDNGEAKIFDDVLTKVDDPKLQKMIQRHRDDEVRHGQLFRECVARTGVDPGPMPAELRALDRIDRKVGGFFSRKIEDERGVMIAYLILQVIEERALEQFGMYLPIFARYDARTAEVFREVIADEERHLKYCEAISRRYAPDEDTRIAELNRLRLLEASAHLETEQANTDYAFAQGIFERPVPRFFWRTMTQWGKRSPILPLTPQARAAFAQAG